MTVAGDHSYHPPYSHTHFEMDPKIVKQKTLSHPKRIFPFPALSAHHI
jgi:hypothetical protein